MTLTADMKNLRVWNSEVLHLSLPQLCNWLQPNHVCFFPPQKLSLLHLASGKKILLPATNNENSPDDSFEYIPPKVSYCRCLTFLLSVCFYTRLLHFLMTKLANLGY